MVGQSQSGYRQLDQCQVHALVKNPFAPDKVLAFECSSSKSRRVKGVKDTERMPVWPGADRTGGSREREKAVWGRVSSFTLQEDGSTWQCPEPGWWEALASPCSALPHCTVQACPQGKILVRIKWKSRPAWRQLESWQLATPCRWWQKSQQIQVNLKSPALCKWFRDLFNG